MVHTGPRLRQHARDMRHVPTRAEDRLWAWLRDRRFDGYKFRRRDSLIVEQCIRAVIERLQR